MTLKYWLALTLAVIMVWSTRPAVAEPLLNTEPLVDRVGGQTIGADSDPARGARRYLRSGVSGLENQARLRDLNKVAAKAMEAALELPTLEPPEAAPTAEAREQAKRLEALDKPASPGMASPVKLVAAPPASSLTFAPLNRVWLKGFGNWSTQERRQSQPGYEFDNSGLMIGYDREIDVVPGLVAGLSGAFSSGELKSKGYANKADLDFQSLGLYGRYTWENGLFLRANLAFGQSDNKTRYLNAGGVEIKSDFDSSAYQLGLTLGYIYRDPIGFRIIPSVGAQYFHIKQKGWKNALAGDNGYASLADWYEVDHGNLFQFPVKLKADLPIELEGGVVLTPELRLGLIVDNHKPKTIMRMGFQDSGYDGATAYGLEPGRNRFQVGAGLKAQVNDLFDVFADYQLDFRQKYKNHNATLGLGLSF